MHLPLPVDPCTRSTINYLAGNLLSLSLLELNRTISDSVDLDSRSLTTCIVGCDCQLESNSHSAIAVQVDRMNISITSGVEALPLASTTSLDLPVCVPPASNTTVQI